MELDLTKEEKIEFVNRLNLKSIQSKLKYGRRYVTSAIFWAIGGVISIIILALKIITPAFFWPVVLLFWFFVLEDSLRGIKALIAAIKDASYGKMSYFQYRKLLKSGELGKWAELEDKKDSEINEVTNKETNEQEEIKEQEEAKEQEDVKNEETQEQEDVTLTAEELAVLKKLMDKKVVKNFDEVEITDKTSKPNDSKDKK